MFGKMFKKKSPDAASVKLIAHGGVTPDTELVNSFKKIDELILYKARCGSLCLCIDYENEGIRYVNEVIEHYQALGYKLEIITPDIIDHSYLFISWDV